MDQGRQDIGLEVCEWGIMVCGREDTQSQQTKGKHSMEMNRQEMTGGERKGETEDDWQEKINQKPWDFDKTNHNFILLI